MTSALLRATGVGARFDGRARWMPSEVGFELRAGEVTLLLGPSGSGKSVLAATLNGLVPHAMPADLAGTVEIMTPEGWLATADVPVSTLAQHVAMVFQDADASLTSGTVFDEVCFGPENLLVPIDEVRERATSALHTVGLWERRDARPEELSGGGRQRLAIAAALAMRTRILVLDEPTANLDPAAAEEVMTAIAAVVAERDRAVLLIEHDLDHCIHLIDRVLVLDASGRVVIDGPARETLTERTQELVDLGIWLPRATVAALALRSRDVELSPIPQRPIELAAAIDAVERMPPPIVVEATRPSGPPVITVTDLSISRRGSRLLDGVDVQIGAGEFVAIVGVNGAGKTTLLQAMCGVLRAPRGRIRIDGLDPARTDAATIAGVVGYVFQNPEHQFIAATVTEELAHGLLGRGLDADRIDAIVDAVLERFGLAEHRDAHPFTLSGGQKRRLSVGTALIGGQRILALDEPTFGQDRASAGELVEMLADLHRDGTTVLVVTHDLQLVADAATRVIVIDGGRILADGPSSEVIGGDALVTAGLRRPPLAEAMRLVTRHSAWAAVTGSAEVAEPRRSTRLELTR